VRTLLYFPPRCCTVGVDVASFGASTSPHSLVWNDPFAGVYKRLFFSPDGTRLLGGILVGDAADYTQLLAMYKSEKALSLSPAELIMGKQGAGGAAASEMEMDDDAQICSCNNISKVRARATG
jgi:nitrite reductase (NADH) large subunit